MESGIYSITNLVNNKIYIGCAKNIDNRRRTHYSILKRNKHPNKHLQFAYNKYGIKNIIFEIIEYCNKEFLYSQENYWCNLLNVHNQKYGYNIAPTSPLRTSVSRSYQKINQYDIHGIFIKTFSNATEASKLLNISYSSIRKVATGTFGLHSAKGFMFRIYNGDIKNIDMLKTCRNPLNSKPRISKQKIRKVECFDKVTNKLIKIYKNCSDAAIKLKIDNSCISKCCRGKMYYYKNFIFKYQ